MLNMLRAVVLGTGETANATKASHETPVHNRYYFAVLAEADLITQAAITFALH